jgi:hypothetical protein
MGKIDEHIPLTYDMIMPWFNNMGVDRVLEQMDILYRNKQSIKLEVCNVILKYCEIDEERFKVEEYLLKQL